MIVRFDARFSGPGLLEGNIMSRSFVPAALIWLGFAISIVSTADRIQAQTQPAQPKLSDKERTAKLAERDRLWKEAEELRDAGNFAEALERLTSNIKLQRKLFGAATSVEADSLEQIALNERDQQHWAEARAAAAERLAIRNTLYGADHWRTFNARRFLADIQRWSKFTDDERAQMAQADRLLKELERLYNQGKYAEAVLAGEQSLALQRQVLGPGDGGTTSCLNNLAFACRAQGNFATAEPLFQQALQIREKILGPEHPDTATSLSNLAALYVAQGKYAAAEPLHLRALKIQEKTLGPDDSGTATTLNNLAVVYDAQGNYAAAEPLYQRALKIREKVYGPDDRITGYSLNDLALFYKSQGNYAAAEPLYLRALKIQEKVSGPEHPETAIYLNGLANLYFSQGNYVKAEPLFERALRIREKVLGPDHPHTGFSVDNLAYFYQSQGKYAAAEPLYQRALKILQKTLGPEHTKTAECLDKLASLNMAMGRYAVAELLYKQALEIHKKALGEAHPTYAQSLNNLALLYDQMGDHARAEPLFKQSLEIHKKTLGEAHPDTAGVLNNLASHYETLGNYAAAEPLYLQSLRIKEKSLGPNHPDTAFSLNNLAGLYQAQGNYAAAEPLFQRALQICERTLGPDHSRTATELNNLALMYEKQGNLAAAGPLHLRALQIREKSLGPDHPLTSSSLNSVALHYLWQGDYAAAAPLFQRALKIRETALGPDHTDTATVLNNLARLYQDQGDYLAAERLFQRALRIYEKTFGPGHPETARSLHDLAGNYRSQGNDAAAEPLYQRALKIQEEVFGAEHPDVADNLNSLADLYWNRGDSALARSCAGRGFDIQRSHLERTAAVQTEQQQFLMTTEVSYHLKTWLTVTSDDPDMAAEVWQRVLAWKGLTTTRQIGLRQALKDDPEYAEFRQVSQQLSTVSLSPPQPPSDPQALPAWNQRAPELRRAWQEQKAKLEAEHERLEKDLSKKSAAFHHDHERRAVTPQTVVASLHQSSQPTALVDLIVYWYSGRKAKEETSGRRLAAFVIRPDGKIYRVELGATLPIFDELMAWRKGYGRPLQKHDAGRELRRLLWEPLEPCLADIDTVLISPDAELAQLPWGALPGAKAGTFLIEERAIAVIPVPQMLPELLRDELHTGPPASLLLAGDIDYRSDAGRAPNLLAQQGAQGRLRDGRLHQFGQLAAAGAELIAVDRQFRQQSQSGSTKILNHELATEESFREQAPHYQWLHVITHGFFAPAELASVLQPEPVSGVDASSPPVPMIEVGPPPGRIGLDLAIREGRCLVNGLVPNGVAAKDGRLQIGDEVVAVGASSGDWLPMTERTIEQIVSHVRGPAGTKARLRVRPKANLDQLAEYELVRAAVPGQLAPRAVLNPGLLSGLAFAGANMEPEAGKDDGVLTALEVSALDLSQVDTVVLSACETGLGQVAGGEGLLGLQRAFQVAGAKTVVASLWKVDDRSTQLLMKEFYGNLWERKLGKLESLRQAQIKLLREGVRWKDPSSSRGLSLVDDQPADSGALPPFYWAAFVLSGDWR
jgi:tetratricopeptide (TPR) repeat protein/CHAT domain-containing protein